jgi:hypothetical protein
MDQLGSPAVSSASFECRVEVKRGRRRCCPEIEGGDRDDRLGTRETQWTREGGRLRLENKGTRIDWTE